MAITQLSVHERLRQRTRRNGECIEWLGAHTPLGYGQLFVGGRLVYVHRLIYELAHGPIAEGLVVDHVCRNPKCVRPSHLEAVTQRENTHRGLRGRLKTHCSQGHEWKVENIYSHRGRRSCLPCRAVRNAISNAAIKRQGA